MFIVAQILGFIAAIINICSIQLKKKKDIIIWLGIVNLLFTICFILLNAYSGAIICFILFLQTIISYIYEIKNKKLPKIFIPIYIIVPTICGFIFYKSYEDILPII